MLKQPRIDSKHLRAAAKDQECISCGAYDGTVVFAHYSGMYSSQLGKAMGRKCEDIYGADLCHKCHSEMDNYTNGNDDERAAEFMLLCLKTIKRRILQGIITIKGLK